MRVPAVTLTFISSARNKVSSCATRSCHGSRIPPNPSWEMSCQPAIGHGCGAKSRYGVTGHLATSTLLRKFFLEAQGCTDDVRLTSWNVLSGHARHRDEGFGFVASVETLALFDAISAKRRPTTHRRVEIAVRLRVPSYFPPFSFAHRASTAFLAISVRCAGESFAARALPPRDCKARS